MGRSSSPIVALQVDLEQEYLASRSGGNSDSAAFDSVLDSRLRTPRTPVAGLTTPLSEALSDVLSLHFHRSRDAQLPLRLCPSWTTTTFRPSRSTTTATSHRSSGCRPLLSPVASSPVAVDLGSVSSNAGSGGAPARGKLLHTPPALPRRFRARHRYCPSPHSQAHERALRSVVLTVYLGSLPLCLGSPPMLPTTSRLRCQMAGL